MNVTFPNPAGYANAFTEMLDMLKHGRCTHAEYCLFGAVWVAEHTREYKPKFMATLPDFVLAYARDRAGGKRAYDADRARKLGDWFLEGLRIREENAANLSLLIWAKEKLLEVGMTEKLLAIDGMIPSFARAEMDREMLRAIIVTKKLDGLERQRNG